MGEHVPGITYQAQSKVAGQRSREAVLGVHVAHCCWIHGCKYGADDCPVTDPTIMAAQAHPCEACDDEIRDNWGLIMAMNKVYDAGRHAGQGEGYQHGFTEGSFRGFRQGRQYAETGKLVPMDSLPYPLAHEVTDEMVAAFGKAWEDEDQAQVYVDDADMVRPGARRRAGLRAVLGILRRDLSGEER